MDVILGCLEQMYEGVGKDFMVFALSMLSSITWGLSSIYALYILDADKEARTYYKAKLRVIFSPSLTCNVFFIFN